MDASEPMREFEDALTDFMAAAWLGGRGEPNLALRTRLHKARNEIVRLKLMHTKAYNDAVIRAESRAWDTRAAETNG